MCVRLARRALWVSPYSPLRGSVTQYTLYFAEMLFDIGPAQPRPCAVLNGRPWGGLRLAGNGGARCWSRGYRPESGFRHTLYGASSYDNHGCVLC